MFFFGSCIPRVHCVQSAMILFLPILWEAPSRAIPALIGWFVD